MKKIFLIFTINTCFLLCNSFCISLDQLITITNELLNDNNLNYNASISIDDHRSSGFASINYNNYSNSVSIYVHSQKLAYESYNTWAFVMGHELAHKYLGRGGTPKSEWDADIYGARWAINSGYEVRTYVSALLDHPDSCGPSHGCWHGRAHNIARRYGVRLNKDSKHRGHKTSKGPFPSPNGTSCITTSSNRKRTLRKVRVPCKHYIQCQHIYWSGYQYVRAHQYDLIHRYDIEYIND